MDKALMMTPEQFSELLAAARSGQRSDVVGAAVAGAGGAGLGAAPKVVGIGCGDGGMGPLAVGVYQMLAAGSPRLALAKALGIPLAPYIINCRAVFPDTATSSVPDVGSDVKITQDTLIDSFLFRIQNESVTANQNVFQAQSDWYYNWQSGIEVTLDVQGAPRYAVVPRFTPIATVADAFNGDAHWTAGWVLSYQQQLKMSFQAKITLPTAPMEVIATFRAYQPVWDELVQMTNREALSRLVNDCGIQIEESYVQRCCR